MKNDQGQADSGRRGLCRLPLKEAVVAHLKKKGWTVTDVGVRTGDEEDTDLMFHRIGLRVGAMISEGEFERALIFCGTGMGIHIAASKCPGVHAGVVEVSQLRCALSPATASTFWPWARSMLHRRWARILPTRT